MRYGPTRDEHMKAPKKGAVCAPISLRACYAMSRTDILYAPLYLPTAVSGADIAYGSSPLLGAYYAVRGTERAYAPLWCYAVCGTEIAYGGSGQFRPSQSVAPPYALIAIVSAYGFGYAATQGVHGDAASIHATAASGPISLRAPTKCPVLTYLRVVLSPYALLRNVRY
eukprot:3941975-Rhodomonas_salina.2